MCSYTLGLTRIVAFHDGLDFVSVHETLIESLKTALASLRGKQPLEAQIEAITQAKASRLLDRVALQNVRPWWDPSVFYVRADHFQSGLPPTCSSIVAGQGIVPRRHGRHP